MSEYGFTRREKIFRVASCDKFSADISIVT